MDLPQFVYHQRDHSRYIPVPAAAPPPHPPFPDDPNFHVPPNHHDALQNIPKKAVDFRLPPRLPSSYRHLPIPPSASPAPQLAYNPAQPQFSITSTNRDDHLRINDDRLRSIHSLRDFTRSPPVSSRISFDGGFHRDFLDLNRAYPESRLNISDPSGVTADNRPPIPHSPIEFEHGAYHREIDHRHLRPYPPLDKFRYDSCNNSRMAAEFSDSFQTNSREDVLRGRGDESYYHRDQFKADPGVSFMESGATIAQSPLSRDNELISGSYDTHRYGSTYEKDFFRNRRSSAVCKNQRWVLSKQTFRNIHNDIGSNDRGDGDRSDFRSTSGKHGHCRLELGKYYNDNRGGTESYNEYTSSPRKQIQKKSAFLRIQVANPSHNNREIEQLHDSDYFDDKNNSSFRGKNQVRSLGHRIDEGKKREGSPMELDVSFKSNSLVAKAIVTSTQPGAVSDMDMTPRNEKTAKALVPDHKSPDSQLTGQNKDTVGTNAILHLATYPSGSKYDLKESKEKVTGLLVDNVSKNLTEASLVLRNYSLGKNNVVRPLRGMVLDKEGKIVSGKAFPVRAMKKKKIGRKVVKKVVSPQLCLQTKKSDDKPAKVDSLTNIPPVVARSDKGLELPTKESTAFGMNSVSHFVSKPSQREFSGSPEKRKADQSLLPIASVECEAKTHMGKECIHEDKSDKNSSNFPLNSLIKEGRGIGDHLERNSSFIAMPSLLNSNKDLKVPNEPNKFNSDSMQSNKSILGENEDLLLEDVSGRKPGLLSFKDPNSHGDLAIGNSLAGNIDIPMNFDSRITQSQDSSPLSESCFIDAISKQLCANVTSPPETDIIGVPAANVTISNSLVCVSNSSEAAMQIDSINSECYSGNEHTNQDLGDCSNCTNIRVNDTPFNCEIISNTRERASVDRDLVSLGIISQERSPEAKVSVNGGKREQMSQMSEIKNCLDFTSPNDVNEETTNSEHLHTRLISKHYCPLEHDVSGLGSVVLGVNPTTLGGSVMHGYSLLGKSSKNNLLVGSNVNNKENEKSPDCRKKQKICVASPILPCPSAESNEGPAITFTSCLEDPLTSNGELMEGKEVAASTVDSLCTASSTDCSKGVHMMLYDIRTKESANKINIDNDPLKYGLQHEHPEKNSPSIQEELIVSKCQSHYPSALGNEQKENGAPIPIMATNQIDNMNIDIGRKKELDVPVSDERSMVCNEAAEWRNSSEVPSFQTFNCLYPMTDKASNNLGQDNLQYLQNHMALSADGNGCCTANSHSKIMASMSDAQVDMGSPVTPNDPGMHKLNCEALLSHNDWKMDCAANRKMEEKSMVKNGLRALTDTSSPPSTTVNQKSGHINTGNNSSTGKGLPLALEESKNGVQAQDHSTDLCKKKQTGYYNSQTFPGKFYCSYIASKKLASATHGTKPRSWHRNVNSLVPLTGNKALSSAVPPLGQLPGRDGMPQSTSYIRKGNSLVRKSSPVATQVWGSHDVSLNPSDQYDCKSSVKAHNNVDVPNPLLFKARGIDTPVGKSYTPPLSSGSKSPNHSISLRECAPSPCYEIESDLMKSKQISDLSRFAGDPLKISLAPESQIVSADKMENQTEAKDMVSVSSIVKKIVYVKRKSNQLVATSNPCELSTNNMDAICSLSSDGYYKRNKNQLVRASLECQMKQILLPTEEISNSGAQSSSGDGDSRRFNKRQLCKAKTLRPLKSSLVWTLCSSVAPGNGDGDLQNQKIVPHLFPWKRTYWRTLKLNTPTHKNSSSSIVRKLLLLRDRNTLYKRSKHGFSLRKSKVLSVGRTSLKWSKSIEKRSKKANEDATRAVANAERKKRECNWDTSVCSEAQGGNQFSYDKSSCSTTLQSEKSAKKIYIPRRLVIGNDEYVKIGNGNQLVRNPKRRVRILANEKIRWSLHTARQRLAKKRKYCQFFTRFGKCDKEGGKCPYIHDTSKIAVCTKFLNGLCSNPSCKLTHKVIPERMPDCSYFLQGLCCSKNCAYRHVNVNSKATTCDAFLRGYCALGNECRKKHSYVCRMFEATGTCPEGTRCKLHHPKKQTKGRKRKRSGGKNNDQGRYFGSKNIDVSVSRTVLAEKHPDNSSDPFPKGDLADYISLDVSDEEVAERKNSASRRTTFCEGYLSVVPLDDPDELIKPVRIMNKSPTMQLPEHSGNRT